MPASTQDKVRLGCPSCGHEQLEPRTAISTVCKKCGRHLLVQEILHPPQKGAEPMRVCRVVACFECGAELEVAVTAESTMCKRCSRYVDLKDYRINSAVSKNFKTKGAFVIEPKGYVFNTEVVAGDAVIKGRLLGKLTAERSLTLFSTAEIKGSFTARRLVIPPMNSFRWKDSIRVDSAEIAGEWVGHLSAKGAVWLRSTARFFGDLDAVGLIVEEGAVVVGSMCIKKSSPPGVRGEDSDSLPAMANTINRGA